MQPSQILTDNPLTRFNRIGLFDSGVGGLSVLTRLAQLKGAHGRSFVYLGDTARCPYGNRDSAEIGRFVAQIVTWLQQKHVDAIIMACNTSAAVARSTAEAFAQVPVFDLISPAAAHVAALSDNIGVMATQSTARSQAFSRAIRQFNPSARVIEYACPDLVPIVESGRIDSNKARAALLNYVARMRGDGVQTVILGCTHFPFLEGQLQEIAGSDMSFVDPAQILSGTISKDGRAKIACEMYVTGSTSAFARTAEICLGYMPFAVKSIEVQSLETCIADRGFAMPRETLSGPAVSIVVP